MYRDEEGVDDSELAVKISNDGLVYHVRDLPNPQAELDQLQVEEIWRQEDATGGRLLGRGGFGAVYKEKCIHDIRGTKLGRFRAVKVIERGDEVTKAYYREELKALAKFSAPRYRSWFVECFGWYEALDKVFINMEHLEHRDLQRYLDRHFSERETNRIAFQVAKGLGFMHQNNFIHRDLKPANLLVVEKPPEKDWWVKIGDFGISKRSTDGRQAYSTVNIGTQEYMAPEVRLFRPRNKGDKASYTVAADIWSLGAICVRLITASPAFDLRGLLEYYDRGEPFGPEDALASQGTSQEGRVFIQAVMARDPKLRPLAQEAIGHAWMMQDKRPFSPGVPQEPGVPLARLNAPSKPEAELAEEYRATAQWDSGVVVDQSVEDPTIRPVAAVPQTPSPATAEWKPENVPRSHAGGRGSGHLVHEPSTQATEDSAKLKPPHVAKDASQSSNSGSYIDRSGPVRPPPSSRSAPPAPPVPSTSLPSPDIGRPRSPIPRPTPHSAPRRRPPLSSAPPRPPYTGRPRSPIQPPASSFAAPPPPGRADAASSTPKPEDQLQAQRPEKPMQSSTADPPSVHIKMHPSSSTLAPGPEREPRKTTLRRLTEDEARAAEMRRRQRRREKNAGRAWEAGRYRGPELAGPGKGNRVVYETSGSSSPSNSGDEDTRSDRGKAAERKRRGIQNEKDGGIRNVIKKFFVGSGAH